MNRQEEALLAEISSLLILQKKNLEAYCLLLQSMESAIASQDDERIREYTALDQGCVEKIVSNRKSIDTYSKLLAKAAAGPASAMGPHQGLAEKTDIRVSLTQLENEIQALKAKAMGLQEKNRERLSAEMELLKNEMLLVRKSIQERKRFPSSFSDEPRYIDIRS